MLELKKKKNYNKVISYSCNFDEFPGIVKNIW